MQPVADGKYLDMKAAADQAPDSPGQEHGDGDRQRPQEDQIPGTRLGQRLLDDREDRGTDDRPLDAAHATDQRYEDHLRRPPYAEDRTGEDVELADDQQRPAGAAPGGGHDVDNPFRPGNAHASTARGHLVVPDRGQVQTHPAGEQPEVAGEQIPHAGQNQQDEGVDEEIGNVRVDDVGKRREQHDHHCRADESPERRSAGARDPNGHVHFVRVAGFPACHTASRARIRPCGRSASTARKTRWPASTPPLGSIRAPTACATPRMMPPTSVPQREPTPPMMTASKAKIRRDGPALGSNDDELPSARPASATVAKAIAAAMPNTWRVLTPAIAEASWSSADARIDRPIAVRERKSCRPTRTTTAVTKIKRGT